MVYSESCQTRTEALAREKWFKTAAGRRRIKQILEQKDN